MNKTIAILMLCLVAAIPFAAAANTQGESELKKANARVMQAKELKERVIGAIEARRQTIAEVKEKLERCAGKRTEECAIARSGAKVAAMENLKKLAESALNMLENARQRVSESDVEAKQEMLDKIDTRIKEVQAAAQKLESMDETSTKQEVKEATRTIQKAFREARFVVKRYVQYVAANKLGNIIVNAEKTKVKLAEKIAEAGGGISTEGFDAAIEEAQEHFDKAKQLRDELKAYSAERGSEKADEAKKELRMAHEALKKAHTELKNILAQIRAKKAAQNQPAEVEDAQDAETEQGNESNINE